MCARSSFDQTEQFSFGPKQGSGGDDGRFPVGRCRCVTATHTGILQGIQGIANNLICFIIIIVIIINTINATIIIVIAVVVVVIIVVVVAFVLVLL